MSVEEPVTHATEPMPTLWSIAELWAKIVKQTWPEHAQHAVQMDDRGTWCVTCDVTLAPANP